MTNSDRLQEIRERVEKATPGPWIAPSWEVDDEPILMPLVMPAWKPHMKTEDGEEYECEGCDDCLDSEGRSADPYFVASAREDIPYLLQLITEQQREIEDLKTKRQVEEARSAAAFKVSEAHPVEFSRALMEEMRQRGLISKGSVEDILTSFVLDRPTAQFPSSKSGGDQ